MSDRLKLFISYSRRDMVAADALVAALEGEDFEVTIDRRDLPYGEEWQNELADFIRGCDTVVWLVSPDSVTSKWCNWELGEVGRLNKRLVPVKIRQVAPEELPESLGKIHLLPADGTFASAVHLPSLVATLSTDRGWVKEATRLADRAREWIARERNSGLLLRGPALTSAEMWSTRQPKAAPAPAGEVLELILASRRGAVRRHRWWTGGAVAVAVTGVSLAGWALWQREVAVAQRDAALITQSRFLVDQATQEHARGDHGSAVLLALEALPDARLGNTRPYLPAAELILYQAVSALRERRVLSSDDANAFFGADDAKPLFAARWSPDGQRIITLTHAAFSVTARLWNATTGQPIARLADIVSIGFSPSGKRIVATKADRTIEIADAVDGKVLRTFKADHMMSEPRFSANETRILATVPSSGRSLPICAPGTTESCVAVGGQVWDIADGKTLKLPVGVTFADFSPDGNRLVATMDDGTAQIWDLMARAPLIVLNQDTDRSELENHIVTSVFSPDGRHILTTQRRSGAWLWNATSFARISLEDSGPLLSAAFSPDARHILARPVSGGASLWSADSYARIAPLKDSEGISHAAFSPNGKRVLGVAKDAALIWETTNPADVVARAGFDGGMGSPQLSPDGQRVAWIGDNNTLWIWVTSADDITVVGRHRERIGTAEFSPDGRFIVTASDGGTARVWDGTEGPIRALRGHAGEILLTAFSADDQRIVTVSPDGTARTWDATIGTLLATKEIEPLKAAAFSHDGRWLVTSSPDAIVRVRDMTSDAPPVELHGHEQPGEAVAISSDGKKVVASVMDGIARLWDVASRGPPIAFGKLPADTVFVEFSRDGRSLVAGTHSEAWVWNVADGKPLRTFGKRQAINAVSFSPDGQLLAAGSALEELRIYDAKTLDERGAWPAKTLISGVTFSPDSKRVIAIGFGAPRIWDIARREEVAALKGDPKQMFLHASFSRDGRRVVVTLREHAWVWPVFPTTQHLVDHARAVVPRPLSPDQRRQHFLDPAPGDAGLPGRPQQP